ncbi:hypothetical protein TPHA_0D02270 [Tetrapisispora phaffii CBS 4417]|uniref:Ribosome maturation protein SDO1/SBDS N-terminal domain-containing protein n=1 Tax=Tetrapisispora phaffii (strain ATCC 24235 / CBS 4417 / NBRC 1672 / NRRL Y-8282 / UCD 70-5) TaxID=1071381 RepID=G8BSP4_TETPH|nr:hypothetical protein TPHA_0D02270 [Tetrapisispora phaffii CBS 4417]CCE62865.1 hypothetical protein TPHA_0D02270 [Tetrapisispora phaffii CBS 4417]
MSQLSRCFYKGEDTDFVVYIKSKDSLDDYLKEPSVTKLTDTVELFQIFSNHEGKGSDGQLGEASHAQLENEFGRGKKPEEVIDLILKNGQYKGNNRMKENTFRGARTNARQ